MRRDLKRRRRGRREGGAMQERQRRSLGGHDFALSHFDTMEAVLVCRTCRRTIPADVELTEQDIGPCTPPDSEADDG